METKRFNIRVYALILRGDALLICDEEINDLKIRKFPGGGLEWGEGIADALKRELKEEAGIEISEFQHFYTTEFFQQSAFSEKDQIVSVYFTVPADISWDEFESDQSVPGKRHMLNLFFKSINEIHENELSFPIDRHVLALLKHKSKAD